MNGVIMDKSSVCRLCGTGEGIKFKIFDPGRDYISKIHQLLPIMIHQQDPWPKLICHRCAFKLQEFYDFREICIKTDGYLKSQGSVPIQRKLWEQPQQPTQSSWIQPSADTNIHPVKIKQEAHEDPPPPLLTPQRPVIQQAQPPPAPPPPQQLMHQQAMLHHQHPLMQQPYPSQVMHQQTQMMPQLMSMLTQQPMSHLMMQRQTPAVPSPQQAPQMQLPMVQFNQKTIDINPRSKNSAQSSRPDAVFLNSGEGECFLPEGPEGAEADSNNDDDDDNYDDRDMDTQGISDHESNQRSSRSQSSGGSARKKRRPDPSYRSKKRSNRSKQQNKSQLDSRSKVDVNNVNQPVHVKTEQETTPYKPGPRSSKPLESQNKNRNQPRQSSYKPIEARNESTFANEEVDNQNTVRKPGPKSKVGSKGSESDDSEVSFVLYKPPNSILDTIDMTQESESTNEIEDDGNPTVALPSHILLTKIPGICNIFTCTLCECTITSKKKVIDHVCIKKSAGGEPQQVEIHGDESGSETGLYTCDVCSMTFTRHVTLMAHKDKHLYTMSDSDSMDSLATLTRKKKTVPISDTEVE